MTRSSAAAAVVLLAAAAGAATARGASDVTFNKDVAPILFSRCVACHQPGGAGPFDLLRYSSARQRATQIAVVTSRGLMPPWKADPEAGEFVGQKRLTASEIDLLQRWAAGGALEGDPHDLPAAPDVSEGWQLGAPDIVVTPEPYVLPADGTDVFRVFVVPVPIDRHRYVRGVEFRPGNAAVVHHANIRVDRTATSRQYDAADPSPGYDGLIAHSAVYPDGHFLGWTPGQLSPLLPDGLSWSLERGTDLVVELHMQPGGKAEVVQPAIGLYFTDRAPERRPVMLRLGRQSIDIPAGEARYTIGDTFVLPVDVTVQAVQPHAHYRAREVTGVATLPDGRTRQLLRIADWDFRWQHVYRYVTPVPLPKGTTLTLTYVYDNSAENPRNPQLPPRRVFWGQRSAEEMGDLWVQLLARDTPDTETLVSHIRPKVLAEDAIGYERVLQSDPDNVALHDDVASIYLQLGRAERAVAHFAVSARLNSTAAAAHFNLATALTVAGRVDEAVARYHEALRLNPQYAVAHNNLGSLYLRTGQVDRAAPHLREAVALDPANAEALYNLGECQALQGEVDAAVRTLRAALRRAAEPLASTVARRIQEIQRRR